MSKHYWIYDGRDPWRQAQVDYCAYCNLFCYLYDGERGHARYRDSAGRWLPNVVVPACSGQW